MDGATDGETGVSVAKNGIAPAEPTMTPPPKPPRVFAGSNSVETPEKNAVAVLKRLPDGLLEGQPDTSIVQKKANQPEYGSVSKKTTTVRDIGKAASVGQGSQKAKEVTEGRLMNGQIPPIANGHADGRQSITDPSLRGVGLSAEIKTNEKKSSPEPQKPSVSSQLDSSAATSGSIIQDKAAVTTEKIPEEQQGSSCSQLVQKCTNAENTKVGASMPSERPRPTPRKSLASATPRDPAPNSGQTEPRADVSKLRNQWESAASVATNGNQTQSETPPNVSQVTKTAPKKDNGPTAKPRNLTVSKEAKPAVEPHQNKDKTVMNGDSTKTTKAKTVSEPVPTLSHRNGNIVPPTVRLVHTVSIYRKLEKQRSSSSQASATGASAPQSPASFDNSGSRRRNDSSAEDDVFLPILSDVEYEEKAGTLQRIIAEKQTHIEQLRQALHVCKEGGQRCDQVAEIEAHKHLLLAAEYQRCLLDEKSFLDACYQAHVPYYPSPPLGTLSITKIEVPLRQEFCIQHADRSPDDIYHFMCTLKYRDKFYCTPLANSDQAIRHGKITFTNRFEFQDLPPDFSVLLKVYCMRTVREGVPAEIPQANGDARISVLRKRRSFLGFLGNSQSNLNVREPQPAPETAFRPAGHLAITLANVNQRRYSLIDVSSNFQLTGEIYVDASCTADIQADNEHGFLHYYEEVSGQAAWTMMWCVLDGHSMRFWNYPEDEQTAKPEVFEIDLRSCIAHDVGPPPEEITLRVNSFALRSRNGRM